MENFPGVPGPPSNTAVAKEAVSTPAILLIITGALIIIGGLLSLVSSLVSGGAGTIPPEVFENPDLAPYRGMFESLQATSGPVGIIWNLITIGLGGVTLFGGLKMKNLENYGLAIAAAIIALIPCFTSCCCIIGIPAGIWSLVVLNKPEVKSAFRPG